MRKQIQKFLAGRLLVIGHSGDDVIQVIPGIHVVCLASCQQGTDHRHIGRRLVVAAEEIILASQRDGPDNISARLLSQSRRLSGSITSVSSTGRSSIIFSVLPLLSLFVDVKVLNISELRNNISTFVQQKQVFRVFLNALDHHYQVTPFHGIAV